MQASWQNHLHSPVLSPHPIFLNHMLETLRACPAVEAVHLSKEFQKDLNWFDVYLPSKNGVYIIHNNIRPPIPLYVDVCATGAGAICRQEAYHTEFSPRTIRADHHICHLDAVNAVAVLRTWAP